MKKRVFGRKLSRGLGSRRALWRGLTKSLVEYGKIETSEAKTKSLRPLLERLVRLGARGTLATRREVVAELGGDKKTAKLFFDQVVPKLREQKGGFTKITRLGRRRGDSAMMVKLEWSQDIGKPKREKKVAKEGKPTTPKEDKK